MTEPVLTHAEERIAAMLADGLSCTRIAQLLSVKKKTVYVHITNIAAKLDNPNELKPYSLVARWAYQEREKRKLTA